MNQSKWNQSISEPIAALFHPVVCYFSLLMTPGQRRPVPEARVFHSPAVQTVHELFTHFFSCSFSLSSSLFFFDKLIAGSSLVLWDANQCWQNRNLLRGTINLLDSCAGQMHWLISWLKDRKFKHKDKQNECPIHSSKKSCCEHWFTINCLGHRCMKCCSVRKKQAHDTTWYSVIAFAMFRNNTYTYHVTYCVCDILSSIATTGRIECNNIFFLSPNPWSEPEVWTLRNASVL